MEFISNGYDRLPKPTTVPYPLAAVDPAGKDEGGEVRATATERQIIEALQNCRFQPGSFDKKLPRDIDPENISPRQQYFIYKLGYKCRKQINNDILETICKNYIESHPEPLTRRESERIAKKAMKPTKQLSA